MDEIAKTLAPVEAEVRKRLGNFILAEDDQTLEGVVLAELEKRHATLTIVETFTSGQIAARIGHLPGAEKVVRRAVVARDLGEVCAAVGLDGVPTASGISVETAEAVARAARHRTAATHALAVLIDLDAGADRIEFAGTICLAIATGTVVASRRSRIVGGPRMGAPRRGGNGPRLPAPAPAGPAGLRAHRFRGAAGAGAGVSSALALIRSSGYAASLTCTPSCAERAIASVNCTLRSPSMPEGTGSRPSSSALLNAATHAACALIDGYSVVRVVPSAAVTMSSPPARLRVSPGPVMRPLLP